MTISAVIFRSEERSEEIAAAFSSSDSVNVVAFFSTSSSTWHKEIERISPQLVIVDLGASPVRSLSLLATIKEAFPHKAFLAISEASDPELFRTAYRLGAVDVVDFNAFTTDLPAAVSLCHNRLSARPSLPLQRKAIYNVLLVCDAAPERCQQITALLNSKKQTKLIGTTNSKSALEETRKLKPDIVWIELSPDPNELLGLLTDLRHENVWHSTIFVSFEKPDVSIIRQSYRLGATDCLDSARWQSDLGAAMQALTLKSSSEKRGSDGSSALSKSVRVAAIAIATEVPF